MLDMMTMANGPGAVQPQAPPPMDDNAIMAMLLESVMGRWGSQEAQLAGEKDVLTQTLMMLAGIGNPMMPPMGMMEGGMGPAMDPGAEFIE